MIDATAGEPQIVDCGDGAGPQPHAIVTVLLPMVDAEALAAARIERGDSDLLAADCKPVAHAVADALVAAGLGRG